MAESLDNFMAQLEETEPGTFVPGSHFYGHEEDSLTLYLRNEESCAHRLNNLITVFLSPDDKLVGCRVKGLLRKLLSDGAFGLAIRKGEDIQLGLFFHLLAYEASEPEQRNRLVELGQETKDFTLKSRELVGCGSD